MIKNEFDAGATKVIIESRESGKQGAFNNKGELNTIFLDNIINNFPLENLIVEAPNSKQQIALINVYGNNINLGNIAPNDLIEVLPTVRLGLKLIPLINIILMLELALSLGQMGQKKLENVRCRYSSGCITPSTMDNNLISSFFKFFISKNCHIN